MYLVQASRDNPRNLRVQQVLIVEHHDIRQVYQPQRQKIGTPASLPTVRFDVVQCPNAGHVTGLEAVALEGYIK